METNTSRLYWLWLTILRLAYSRSNNSSFSASAAAAISRRLAFSFVQSFLMVRLADGTGKGGRVWSFAGFGGSKILSELPQMGVRALEGNVSHVSPQICACSLKS